MSREDRWTERPSARRAKSNMASRLLWLAVGSSWVLSSGALAAETSLLRQEQVDHSLGDSASGRSRRALDGEKGDDVFAHDEEIIIRDGILFQTKGCPQVISAEEAQANIADDSIRGNVITLTSDGPGRAGNHYLTISTYLAMAYCCKTKVLTLPSHDGTFPSAVAGEDAGFESDEHVFDFSGVDTMPLAEYEGLSEDPLVCEPEFEKGGLAAFRLVGVHADLLSCMNRVYLRGCEAAYLEPLLGTEGFDYCPKPAATHGRRLSNDNYGRRDAGTETTSFINGVSSRVTKEASESLLAAARAGPGAAPPSGIKQADHLSDDRSHDRRHSSGSDMIAVESDRRERRSNRVRSKDKRAARTVDDAVLGGRRRLGEAEHGGGEILANGEGHPSLKSPHLVENVGLHSGMSSTREPGSAGSLVIHIRSGDIFLNEVLERSRADFLGYGQPPLQFYLHAIDSQPWSDVTIITYSATDETLNPTFVALEMMQKTGRLGTNITTHKDRDLLTDIRSMLCADGLAISRSTLHFLTFAHTRANHFFIPSECGPGTYTRKTRVEGDGTKKPNPNNTTLLCIEKPEAEVYGVEWEVNEEDYFLYNGWEATDSQRLDMVLFDGIKGLSRCCAR